MRENLLTLLIKSPISQWAARSPFSLSLSSPHLSAHLCQGGLSGVVKLSIARKCSFIKADRRGGRLLKLITPWSCSKPQSFTVQHLRKGRTCREREGDRESDLRLKQKHLKSYVYWAVQLKQERPHLQSESESQSSKLHIFSCVIINQAQNPQRFVLTQPEMTPHPDTRLISVFIFN